jgi:starvation-inducible DNA-binding protein
MAANTATDGLRRVLADTYALYSKTHGYHWNVTGERFAQLHEMFAEQYTELWNALDPLAERIRSLGEYAPQGFRSLASLSSIDEGVAEQPARDMVKDLISGHEVVTATLAAALEAAEAATDPVTVDLLTQRLAVHARFAWMLRATAA